MRPLLSIEGLTVSFGGDAVLHGVDFIDRQGRGAGPRRRVRFRQIGHLACRARPACPNGRGRSGRVMLDGTNILGAAPRTLDTVRGRRVAMIFQDPASALNPVLTIRRQLSRGAGAASRAVGARAASRMQAAARPRRHSRRRAAACRPIRTNFPADRTSAS